MVDTTTISTLPNATEADFNTNLQTFLAEEDAERYALMFTSFISSGGTHATGAGLTHALTTVGFPAGYYVSESANVTYPDDDVTWVAVHKDTTTDVGGNWTRVSGTHYLINAVDATQPSAPSGGTLLIKVTTSSGAVTTVDDIRTTSPVAGIGGSSVDETDTDTTKDKFVSNSLALGWENGRKGDIDSSYPLTLSSISAPSTPAADKLELYHTSTELYVKDENGVVERLTGISKVIELTIFDSDENCATGTDLALSVAQYAGTITAVHAESVGAGSTGTMTIDININGTTCLSTKLTIDTGETGSDTAGTPAVISNSSLSQYDRITVDIDGIHTTPATGLVVSLSVRPT